MPFVPFKKKAGAAPQKKEPVSRETGKTTPGAKGLPGLISKASKMAKAIKK